MSTRWFLIKQAQIFFRLQQELMTLLVSNNVTIMIFFLPQSFLSVFSRANKPLNVGDEKERERDVHYLRVYIIIDR